MKAFKFYRRHDRMDCGPTCRWYITDETEQTPLKNFKIITTGEVAHLPRYTSIDSFYHTFRNNVGYRPSQWRNRDY